MRNLEAESTPSGRKRRLTLLRSASMLMAMGAAAVPCAAGVALVIHPPDGFTVRQGSPDADPETEYDVTSVSDPDIACAVTFAPPKAGDGRDQAALNAEAATPGHRARVTADLAARLRVRAMVPFSMQGADGLAATTVLRDDDGQSVLVYDVEVPRGRLEIECVSSSDEADAWRPVFERIARGVALPR